MAPSKMLCLALAAGAYAFAPQALYRPSTELFNSEKGAGGMFDTRNPDPVKHEDPRKSISVAPSFEEYMKMRSGGAAAPAPAAPAPAAAAPAWGQPAAPAAPAPAWGQPAAPAAPAGWGQPAAYSAPAPAAAPAGWGQPAAYSAPAPAPWSPQPAAPSGWGQPAAYSAPAPAPQSWAPPAAAPAGHSEKGAGGMFDTRNPEPVQHEDPRKSISVAPSFEEYMKSRNA